MTTATALPAFDMDAFYAALDADRRARGWTWFELADALWEQSAELNAHRADDHPLCGGAVSRLQRTGAMSCQYALYMLRWLGRPPEDFLAGPVVEVGGPAATGLPAAGPDQRLRWDLRALYDAVDARRRADGLTWVALARRLGCTPSRVTNLRSARQADLDLTMRITQWLGRPAAAFVRPTRE